MDEKEKKEKKAIKKEAEEEKTKDIKKTSKELEEKRKAILEKAKKLAEITSDVKKIEKDSLELSRLAEEDLKGVKTDNLIVPLEDYVKSGLYIGTKVITPDMKAYVFKRRKDGLAIINTKLADERLRMAASMLSRYEPDKIIVACKREAGWNAAKLFSKLTGIKVFTKKYPAGVITNTKLPEFFNPEVALIVDPWIDKNLLLDASKINIPIISLCDTNNITNGIDLVIPSNNKSNKSIGLVFWVLAREYIKSRGINSKLPPLKEFMGIK